jgi:hypothetical protein
MLGNFFRRSNYHKECVNKKENVENMCQAEAKGSSRYFPGSPLEAAMSI